MRRYGRGLGVATVMAMIGSALGSCVGSGEPSPEGQAAIESHFRGRTELAPIEGVWLREDQQCEVVVFRSRGGMNLDYAYVGLVTKECYYSSRLADTGFSSDRGDFWVTGAQFLSIKGAEPDGRYPASWHDPTGTVTQAELYLAGGNLYLWDYSDKWGFLRVYPEKER